MEINEKIKDFFRAFHLRENYLLSYRKKKNDEFLIKQLETKENVYEFFNNIFPVHSH